MYAHLKHIAIGGAALLAVLLLFGVPLGTALPYALLLACPLMMIGMMGRGHGHGGHDHAAQGQGAQGHAAHGQGAQDHATHGHGPHGADVAPRPGVTSPNSRP